MSRGLIARSPDLRTLEVERYSLRIVDDAFLVIDRVPYVTAARQVQRADLVMVLTLRGDKTAKPGDHVAYWSGEHPHRANGRPLDALLVPNSGRQGVSPSFPSVLMFSAKADYRDYHHKVTTYTEILGREARSIEAGVTARGYSENAG
jgi:hypothetical protein